MSETVARRRRTESEPDRFNNTTFAWADPEPLPGEWAFDPGTSAETLTPDRAKLATSPTLYAIGHWPDLAATDRLVVRGADWTVEGTPAFWRHLDGNIAGGTVTLQAVTEEA